MNFLLAILIFLAFTVAICAGIVLMLAGKPLIFILSMLVFVGTFVKYGCLSH